MGSCQSTPVDSTTAEGSPAKGKSVDTERKGQHVVVQESPAKTMESSVSPTNNNHSPLPSSKGGGNNNGRNFNDSHNHNNTMPDDTEPSSNEEASTNGGESHCVVQKQTPKQNAAAGAAAIHRNSSRVPLSRPRAGYSSGGSSEEDYIDDENDRHDDVVRSTKSDEGKATSLSPCRRHDDHLTDWKNELLADGDLSKAVVRIETDFGRPIEEVYDGVHDGDILGSGVSGVVRRVKHRSTGVDYAVKCLDLGLIMDADKLECLRDEIFIMCQLDHPNIVRLEEVYENQNEIYLIQELCLGGDLFDRLDEQPDFHYTEAQCARLVKQMLSSIRYLHSKNIIHRDLKLENFLFSSQNPDSELKMIDFGLSKHFAHNGEVQHEMVGTPYTVAPEVIRGKYDERCDIWALGVITYLLLCGETPFGGIDGENLLLVRKNILCGSVCFEPEDIWELVSAEAKSFVKRLLHLDPAQRPSMREAQKDPWIQVYAKKDSKEGCKLSPNIAASLIEFKEYSDMRKLLCEVLSFTLLPEQIVDLRKEFEKIDADGTGEISLKALKQVFVENAEAGTLGALTESEVEDIFNALRVSKSETTIRWHEFIAAGLSQCNFDERNLRLAFDRLDYDRKGFISFDDMVELLGSIEGEEAITQIWHDGITECECPAERITYQEFLKLMKGQSTERELPDAIMRRASLVKAPAPDVQPLEAVPEGAISPMPKRNKFNFDSISPKARLRTINFDIPPLGDLSMPDFAPPLRDEPVDLPFPDLDRPTHKKTRSKSFEVKKVTTNLDDMDNSRRQSARSFLLPSRAIDELSEVIQDESKTPLVVNRALYRKHREMRLAVLEASKLFDVKRQARQGQLPPDGSTRSSTRSSTRVSRTGLTSPAAGLVMRRGSVCLSGSNRSLNVSDHLSDHARPEQVEEASRRSGRPRRQRKKTMSDMSGMLK